MGSWITPELVGNQFPRGVTLALQHFTKEPFRSSLVPLFRHQDVESVAVLIDSTPEIELFSLNFHEDFVDVPSMAQPALPSSDRPGIFRPKLQAPEPNYLVGDRDATLGEEILHIAEAEREPMVEPNSVTDNLRRKSVASVAGFHAPIVADHADCGVNLTKPSKPLFTGFTNEMRVCHRFCKASWPRKLSKYCCIRKSKR